MIIDGRKLAKKIRKELRNKTSVLLEQDVIPGLAVIILGEHPASMSYVTAKKKAAVKIGINAFTKTMSVDTSQTVLLDLIRQYNADESIHGILVQLPLPKHIQSEAVIEAIDPAKDVDGFHPSNVGKMMLGQDCFLPCTPHGVIKMLESINYSPAGKHVVIVGRSDIVGKPLANLLLRRGQWGDATVTVCHSKTPDLKKHTLQADILIAAVGRPEMITADMVQVGAVVIDVGVNRISADNERGYRLVGDVEYDAISEKAYAITPVPGGVGPMTIAMLMWNTVESASQVQ